MKQKTTAVAIFVMVLMTGLFVQPVLSAIPETVSPGEREGHAVIGQDCPTFSWSVAADALTYRLEVYELDAGDAVSRDQMRQMTLPVVKKEIPGPAYSWTAALGECLAQGGSYIWYVQGLDARGEGAWSEGRMFGIEPQALTVGQEEEVQEVVKEYLEADRLSGTENTDISLNALNKEIKAAAGISLPLTLTEGTTNTLLGTGAGASLTTPATGSQNATFIGLNAGTNNTTGKYNTFVGSGAGYSTIGGGTEPFITGHSNSFFGRNAGYFNQQGSYNSFFGYATGYKNTASYNSFFGYQAGHENTAGQYNSFFGNKAGWYNNTGSYNSFFGSFSGYNLGFNSNTGSYNSFFGAEAGYNKFSGSNNSFLGAGAGYWNQGDGNVFLGYNAGFSEGGSNRLYIANSSTTAPLIYGEFDNGIVKINGDLVVVSDERLKENIEPIDSALDKVMQLEGVSYLRKSAESEGRGFGLDREIGLLAQNVETVLPELVHTDSRGYKAVAYDKMVAVLIEAIKERQSEMREKVASFEAAVHQQEANFEESLKEKNARFEELLKEKDASVEKLTLMLEELSARVSAGETPLQTVASRED